MAVSFADVKSIIDQNIGTLKTVTIGTDATKRGGVASSSGSGLIIKRDGSVTGSLSGGNITLEGGGIGWEGALTQDNVSAYYTRAQRVMLTSLLKYIDSMSDAEVTNNLDGVNGV